MSETSIFSAHVVRWQEKHGRSHLPWQQTRDPYRVWLSEVMLQQTQVSTVLEYYPRFLVRFPDVAALAEASEDEVLALWSGLGYYSRARNLHRCARQVMALHGGAFPATAAILQSLPGIGRSTAGAIAAFCFGERAPILDANVRRVLTRILGFDADLALAANERALWERATELLPSSHLAQSMPRYTQGLMDLGAMVCLVRKPLCTQCPLQSQCVAQQEGTPEKYPVKTRKLIRKSESWWLLLLRDTTGRVCLNRRPSTGIWPGLHSLPMYASRGELVTQSALAGAMRILELPSFLHVLTHRDLHLHPVMVELDVNALPDHEEAWFSSEQWRSLGLPAPIRKLLETV
ncbi:A/G-specific adenine glycosylase [Simplicispira psychrophila]|uniref:A/G-specific adenine glycosylase n=1 Tax=Simplicispira psychrophila TaxID=80882 RepID=UPI00048608C1|nr:A/G-specific adenine glycosylase [Simplicispira psychrophila]